jgi:hypothetical protein
MDRHKPYLCELPNYLFFCLFFTNYLNSILQKILIDDMLAKNLHTIKNEQITTNLLSRHVEFDT